MGGIQEKGCQCVNVPCAIEKNTDMNDVIDTVKEAWRILQSSYLHVFNSKYVLTTKSNLNF
jgi:hypothetical protein